MFDPAIIWLEESVDYGVESPIIEIINHDRKANKNILGLRHSSCCNKQIVSEKVQKVGTSHLDALYVQ